MPLTSDELIKELNEAISKESQKFIGSEIGFASNSCSYYDSKLLKALDEYLHSLYFKSGTLSIPRRFSWTLRVPRKTINNSLGIKNIEINIPIAIIGTFIVINLTIYIEHSTSTNLVGKITSNISDVYSYAP